MRDVNERRLKELENIKSAHGGILKPEHVVAFARDESTALHAWFDWDNDAAAEKYRLVQARTIIRIMVAPVEGVDQPVRINVSIMEDRKQPGGGYRSLEQAMADPDLRKKVLQTVLIELTGVRRRYKALNELADVFASIDQAEMQYAPSQQEAPQHAVA